MPRMVKKTIELDQDYIGVTLIPPFSLNPMDYCVKGGQNDG